MAIPKRDIVLQLIISEFLGVLHLPIYIPDQKRMKVDDKGEKCIFLGVCSDQLKAYKLHNPITKKIIISWDVVFDEETFRPWSNNEIEKDYMN